jgi:hypothetical protein
MGGLWPSGDAALDDVLGERLHHGIVDIRRRHFPLLAEAEKPVERETPLRVGECF